jgi:hypothetical protein
MSQIHLLADSAMETRSDAFLSNIEGISIQFVKYIGRPKAYSYHGSMNIPRSSQGNNDAAGRNVRRAMEVSHV